MNELLLERAYPWLPGDDDYWCLCTVCGTRIIRQRLPILNGNVKCRSCLKKQFKNPNYIDGRSKHYLYNTWNSMLDRCENSNSKDYCNYGGRGIKVCERWHDFWKFVEDVGERPEGMTLDRKDNDGNYDPNNWQWATKPEQNRNRR